MTDQMIAPAAPGSLDSGDVAGYLKTKFPDAVKDDTRQGYSGVVIDRNRLVEVAESIKNELGYNYLSSATAVDYLGIEDSMEMVYHAYRTSGGGPLVFKAQTPRENAEIPSLIDVWPGADFQEREAYDLYGIHFPGHPNQKRILMWEGFEGHPMRKDWKEAYYEQELKPFDSRWPKGYARRAEELNMFGKNVKYPSDLNLSRLTDHSESSLYSGMGLGVDVEPVPDSEGLQTDKLVVNLGPHHPSTHGVFRMVVTLNGETIDQLEPVMGYLHRNHEKIGERNAWNHNMPFTDRLDYISSMSNNLGYAQAVEKLMALGARYTPPTYRAEVIRVLMVELTRIVNHLWAIGFLLNDLGAFFTPSLYGIAEREKVLDFFEAVSGSRMMCNYMRFGGVFKDLPERIRSTANLVNDQVRDFDTMKYLTELINDSLPRAIDEYDRFLTDSEIIKARTQGVGYLPAEMAIAYSAAGPLLRGSGVAYDVRRAEPYSIYPELDFDVAVRYNGDIYDRYLIRLDEMRESVRILKQILPRLEATKGESIFSGNKAIYMPRVPIGESYGRVENPKGELGYYTVSQGDPKGPQNPWRYHVRAPSFINLTALGPMCKGQKVADVVAILGSIDIVLGETDR
ncbi:MAG: NADH-quinone oxidoreductase subunit D [Pleurocapsa minor GSE-CHR-MK-17-07R]|jgi:NADH-quinone oxidoreductase subunit D/NADH-quinone oxidoreductase subunit C/D|nr:NADH-quinone oxidoreductase subunit D [Pleurocapsa minor GSE-CHR-MK 17-07R]